MGWVGSEIFAYEMGWVGFSCLLLTYRFLIYVADLNYIMLLFDDGLGHE